MATYQSLDSFGTDFFKKKGGYNPVAIRRNKKDARSVIKAVKNGDFNYLLKVCAITGRKSGQIKPAEVKLSKNGGFDTIKMLVHRDVKVGDRNSDGRTVLSIRRGGLRASIKTRTVDKKVIPYVHIFRVKIGAL